MVSVSMIRMSSRGQHYFSICSRGAATASFRSVAVLKIALYEKVELI